MLEGDGYAAMIPGAVDFISSLVKKSCEQSANGTFVADLVLQILSYVAQTERENIKQRQKEGIAAAKLRGVRFGRPRKPVPVNFDSLRAAWNKGDISSRQAAAQLGIAQDTFLRWAHGK